MLSAPSGAALAWPPRRTWRNNGPHRRRGASKLRERRGGARAGGVLPLGFHTGATIHASEANYDGLAAPYGAGVPGQYRGRPIAAGSLARNAFGLYDVYGNVAEMVADRYHGGGSGCTRRVVRGGSWGSAPRLVRSAYRSWCAPSLRSPHNGFRVAREL